MAYDIEKMEDIENMDGIGQDDVNGIIAVARNSMESVEKLNTEMQEKNKIIADLKAQNLLLTKRVDTGVIEKPNESVEPEDIIKDMFGLG